MRLSAPIGCSVFAAAATSRLVNVPCSNDHAGIFNFLNLSINYLSGNILPRTGSHHDLPARRSICHVVIDLFIERAFVSSRAVSLLDFAKKLPNRK